MSLLFTLDEEFVAPYREKPEPFGFGELGRFTFVRTYARTDNERLPIVGYDSDGYPIHQRESWVDVCQRVTEGTFTILLEHVRDNGIKGWNLDQVSDLSREFFDRLFKMEWTPPGRGLWMMGTKFVHEREVYEALQNCGFVSTKRIDEDHGEPFAWFMSQLMVGVGVGADVKGSGRVAVKPSNGQFHYTIPDSRQGWTEYVRLLMNSYLMADPDPIPDFSLIRPRGKRIHGFGGRAEGPEHLALLDRNIRSVMDPLRQRSAAFGTVAIADIFNLIGKCVVAGNVRRSAEILLGSPFDSDFMNLKNPDRFPERNAGNGQGWAHYSNNSILLEEEVGPEVYRDLAELAWENGEPGIGFMFNTKRYARMNGVLDDRDPADGANPCYEIGLEDRELCTLAEVHMMRTHTKDTYLRALKMAQLYAFIVTLANERLADSRTREVMSRNRRTGTGQTGIAGFVANHGMATYRDWSDHGYLMTGQLVRDWSKWLGIPEAVRRTSIKPSGTVALLSGNTPGIHFPWDRTYIRRETVSADSLLVERMQAAGYAVRPYYYEPDTTMVVDFPVMVDPRVQAKPEYEIPIEMKIELAATAATWHCDNAVSLTASFLKDELSPKQLASVLQSASTKLKSISVLPSDGHGYEDAPYESISLERFNEMRKGLKEVSYEGVGHEADDEFCASDACLIPPWEGIS